MAQPRDPMNARTLEAFIPEKMKFDDVPGLSVSVVKGDRVVWERGFGLADLATSTAATSQTSYLWFSMRLPPATSPCGDL